MGSFQSQLISIRSSYNTQKKNWTIEEIATILAKEEDNIKEWKRKTVFVITDSNSQKRKTPPMNFNFQRSPFKKKNIGAKKNGSNVASTSNEAKSEGFKLFEI